MVETIKKAIREVPDFPKPGINFKDITTLLNNPEAFKGTLDLLENHYKGKEIDFIVGLESRGFIFGCPIADRLGAAFVPIRKPGKLPGAVESVTYDLEYGSDTLQIHKDAFASSSRKKVLIIDDLLATGGSAAATVELIKKAGGTPIGAAFVIELDFLKGKDKLPKGFEIYSLVHY